MKNSILPNPRMSCKNWPIVLLVICASLMHIEAGEPASHLQIMRDLPSSMRKDIPIPMFIRSNYKGAVHFQEGNEFEVLINITAPTVEDAYSVHIELVEYKEGLLLQLYQRPLNGHVPGLKWVFLTVGISTMISFFFALICANSWNKSQGFLDVSGQPTECYDMTQQPMMYRSRNSMYLASQGGDLPLHAEEEADNNQNEDTLKGVPEMPEEEEAEALRMGGGMLLLHAEEEEADIYQNEDTLKGVPEMPDEEEADTLRMEELKKSGAFEATKDLSDDSGGERDEEETEFMKSEYATLPVRVDLAWPEKKGNGDEGMEQCDLSESSSRTSIIEPSSDFQEFQSAASDESRILVTAAEIHSKDGTKQYKSRTAADSSDAFVNVLVKPSQIDTPSFSPTGNIQLADEISTLPESGQSSAFRSSSDPIFGNEAQKVFLGTTDTTVDVDPGIEDPSQMFPMPNLEEVQPASSITSSAESKAAWLSSSVSGQGQPRLATFRPISPRAASPGKLGSPMTPDSGDETNGRSQSNQSTPKRSKTLLGVAPPQVPPKYQSLRNSRGAESPKEEQPGQGQGTSSGSVGRKPTSGSKHMYLAIMSCMCLLSLAVGVYSYGNEITETEIIVTVSTPRNFLLNDSAIFFSMNKTSDLKIFELPLKVTWFEVKNPILMSYNSDMCESRWCEQGCDENTGRCICRKGYKLDLNEKCADVNECSDGTAQCHAYAGCLNTKGSYQCVCSGEYYGDGQSCQECSAPCEKGMFEVQPCSDKEQKICEECTKDCGKGYYMHRQCGLTFNAKCRNKTELPTIQTSSNVLKEDRSKVKDVEHDVRYLPDMEWKYENTFDLQRGSNMAAKIEVRKLDPVHKFMPIDHSTVNDNQAFYDRSILHKYCPYPMPAHYLMEYVIHKDVTYEMDRGVNTNDQLLSCRGYKPMGHFPDLRQPDRSSLLCAKIGPLAKMFGIEEELTEKITVRVEKSIRKDRRSDELLESHTWSHELEDPSMCEKMNMACENCTKLCAWQPPIQKDDCKVLGDEADNGWSPRLRVCYTCCLHTKCSSICDRYYSSPCRPKICLKGSVLEFILKPMFKETMYCHVHPTAQRTLLEVDFAIMYDERLLYKETFQIGAKPEWLRDGSMNNIVYKFLQIDISSGLEKMPDIVAMDQTTKSLKSGLHRKSGHNLAGSVVQGDKLFIHPQEVFGVSLQNWALQNCSHDILEKLMMVSEKDEPYIEMTDVLTSHIRDNTYMIVNNSVTPKAIFRVPRTMSLLQWVASYGRIKHDSLSGSIQHSSSRWVVMLEGSLEACPGFFSVNLTDTTYYDQPLFQYDLLVECPPHFQLTFSIPTSDAANVEKAFTASVRDANVTYHLTIHRPPQDPPEKQPITSEEEAPVVDEDGYDKKNPFFSSSGSFFIPFIASICGAIIILLSVAGFGIVARQGCIDANEVSLFNQRHLMVSVIYFSCQIFYSTLVTLTSFMVIIYAINKDPLSFLSQYDQLSIVKASLTKLEMTAMKVYLQSELERQHAVANQTKGICEEQMKKVAQGLNELKGNLTKEAKKVMSKENLSNLIRNHTRRVLEDFLERIVVYRDRLKNYVRIIQKRLQFDVKQTYHSVMENRWLTGAKYLHSSIQQIRENSHDLATRSYTEWMQIEPNISNLALSLSLSVPKLPRFEEVFREKVSPTNTYTEPPQNKSGQTNYTRNLWFYTEHKHSMGHRNMTDYSHKSSKKGDNNQLFYTFVGIMVIIDAMWFLHRMVNIMRTTRLLLYGYPVYVDCREGKDRGLPSLDNAHRKPSSCCKSAKKRCCHSVSKFFSKILKTMFVPKMIISLLMVLFIYLTSAFSEKLFRRESFQALGYYTDITSLLELSRADINSRIRMHATQINAMEYPMLEAWMNSYLKRHLYLHDVYQNSVRKLSKTHSITYCEYLQRYLPDAKCTVRDLSDFKVEVKGCKFPPIEPKTYQKVDDQHSRVAARQMDSFLYAVRKMISDSCFIVLLYMSFIILWDLTSTVIWLYVKRAGWIRLRVICETDERPMVRDK
ncbi:uncharacterized protein LOC115209612 isoform X5 [Octopus sinensis]|uniref:Uncharacterized protein LOC115209612 isoform X5 n=1 Tax=Octopus sinensis TaxID=2607531 RepID=A0A7E6EQT9_9MOLL|nr:uncharacterized protein LOC115209612 isoform X5 [Octopus sinensis]